MRVVNHNEYLFQEENIAFILMSLYAMKKVYYFLLYLEKNNLAICIIKGSIASHSKEAFYYVNIFI